MMYLCIKQLSIGGMGYHPGEVIPDGVILPERSGKLIRSGYISEWKEDALLGKMEWDGRLPQANDAAKLYTLEQVEKMVAEAVDEAVDNTVKEMVEEQERLQGHAAELIETAPGAYDGTVQIGVKGESDGQYISIPAAPGEIQQAFSILQMNAEEGIRAIAEVGSENVLILVHAADSRSKVKNAAKKQADKLSPAGGDPNGPVGGNGTTGTGMEGADT